MKLTAAEGVANWAEDEGVGVGLLLAGDASVD